MVWCSSLPNFTSIGETCRPCGVKNPKIGPRVKAISAELPFGQINPAGKLKYNYTATYYAASYTTTNLIIAGRQCKVEQYFVECNVPAADYVNNSALVMFINNRQ